MSPDAAVDCGWMEQALALGALGEGTTSPNPRVGCLLVHDGRLVGSGFHRVAGGPHAEALALEQAGAQARGATAYVNLEPCAHEGRTPPCAELLIESGVRRVVAAMQDPNPLVDGRGFAALRRAGVAVEVGLLADEALGLNAPFVQRHREDRPMVTIKAALTLDGMIAAAEGRSRWISSEPARRFAHRLRFGHDAVLIGAGTLRADDPCLTVRLPGVADPGGVRAVLAPRLDIDSQAALFRAPASRRPRVYAGEAADVSAEERLHACADVVRVPESGGKLDLRSVLDDLARCDVQSVLVEGGARTFAGFLEAGLADRAAFFVTPKVFGARGGTPLIDRPSVSDPTRAIELDGLRQLALGRDLLMLGSLRDRGGEA